MFNMKKKGFYFLEYLYEDLTYNRFIFWSLILVLTVCNIFSILFPICANGFSDGIENVKNKLGADIIIVSDQYDEETKELLFMGKPSTISFKRSIVKDLEKMEEIKNISSQLFLSSLSSSCCESKVQFVVYDDRSDFILKPWIEQYRQGMRERDIIIGSNINYNIGDRVTFFDCVFVVAGKLRKTGMGYDECVFVNQDACESITHFLEMDSFSDQASMVLVTVKDKQHLSQTLQTINNKIKKQGLVAYQASNMYTDISAGISKMEKTINIFVLSLNILCFISIFVIITLHISGKTSEILSLLYLGVKRKTVLISVCGEGVMIVFFSFFLSSISSVGFLLLFSNAIQTFFELPLKFNGEVFEIIISCFVRTIFIVFMSSLYSVYNINKKAFVDARR